VKKVDNIRVVFLFFPQNRTWKLFADSFRVLFLACFSEFNDIGSSSTGFAMTGIVIFRTDFMHQLVVFSN